MIPDADKIEKKLLALQERKDAALLSARDVIRFAGKAITAMHGGNERKVGSVLKALRAEMLRLRKLEPGFEYNTLQAHQEYVEAMALHGLLDRGRLPGMRELDEGEVAYLLGVMDLVGELKRKAFDSLRTGRTRDAELCYRHMTDIYDSTYSLKFANSLVPDFRKKQDVARIQVEHLRSELLFAKRGTKESRSKL